MRRSNKDFMNCKCDPCTERRELMEGNQKYYLVKFVKVPDHLGCTIDEWIDFFKKHEKDIPQYIDRDYLPSGMSKITTYYPIIIIKQLWEKEKGKRKRGKSEI